MTHATITTATATATTTTEENIMESTLTAAQAAEIVQTSNNPTAILEAWETAAELFRDGVEDEDIVIALTAWTANLATPEEVIESAWKDQQGFHYLADGVWEETQAEILGLPETPEEIREEILGNI